MRSFFCLLILFFSISLGAQIDESDPLTVETQMVPFELKPFQPAKLILRLKLPNNYHAYADQFAVRIDENSGFQLGEWSVGPLKTWFDKFSKKDRQGISGQAEMVAELIAPENPKSKTLNFEIDYQACSDTFCLFPQTKKLSVEFGTRELNNMSSSNEVMGWDLQELFQKSLKESLWMALLFAFVAGFLTSLSPCVYPMIPITLAVLSRGSEKRGKLSQLRFSIFYVLGIATTFSVLGLAAAQFGFLFGSLLNETWILALISGVLFLMGISLLGFFDIQPPAILMKIASSKNAGGLQGAFISGLFFGVVASPCVGPILVAILAWVSSTQNPGLGFILLFTYALGLGVLFILLGLFSQSLPKSGRWMEYVKKAMGLLVIAVSLYYGQLLWQQVRSTSAPQFNESELNNSALPWKKLTSDSIQQAKGKPIMIDFWALWCAACHELEQNTFSDPEVQKALQGYELFKYDATQVTPETKKWLEKFSIRGLPAIIFYSENGVWLENLTLNEYESPERFLARLKKVKEYDSRSPQ